MAYVPQLEVALALGLQLSLKDRLKLVERLVASVEGELDSKTIDEKAYSGNDVFALLEEFDLSEWENVGIDDPVKWIKQLRRKSD